MPKIRFRPDAAMSDAENMHVYIEVSSDGRTWVSVSSFFVTKADIDSLVEAAEEYFS